MNFRNFRNFIKFWKFWNLMKFFEFLWNVWNFMKFGKTNFFPNSRFLVRSVFFINVSIFTSVVCYYQNGILYPELSFLLRYRLYLCQRPFYKIVVKVRNSKQNVLKIVLIIVNINRDENKSLISNQFSLKNYSPPPTSWRTILRR